MIEILLLVLFIIKNTYSISYQFIDNNNNEKTALIFSLSSNNFYYYFNNYIYNNNKIKLYQFLNTSKPIFTKLYDKDLNYLCFNDLNISYCYNINDDKIVRILFNQKIIKSYQYKNDLYLIVKEDNEYYVFKNKDLIHSSNLKILEIIFFKNHILNVFLIKLNKNKLYVYSLISSKPLTLFLINKNTYKEIELLNRYLKSDSYKNKYSIFLENRLYIYEIILYYNYILDKYDINFINTIQTDLITKKNTTLEKINI